MNAGEFSDYLGYFIPDYAAEIATNYGLSDAESLAQAKYEVLSDLPDGISTPGQELRCIVANSNSSGDVIGYLWYRIDTDSRSAFISDFYIFPEQRGKGYGRHTLNTLENTLSRAGIDQLKLRVAAENERAHHVYKAAGFRTTGFNMSKRIGTATDL
jgi:ribosomal protein S18 acetylase RimI-like enzyme